MFVVSAFGLVDNIAMTILLGHDHGGHGHGHGVLSRAHGQHHHGHGDPEDRHHGISVTGHHHHHHHHDHQGGSSQHDNEQHNATEAGVAEPLLKNCSEGEANAATALVLGMTIRILQNIVEVLIESTPREIDATKLENCLCEMDEVVAIHRLHIGARTVGKVLLACHVIVNGGRC
ncbi:hypothetical protein TIFTF001_009594 [Ficus carica]|uniref:Uncharacterized protein n=1 Tax=Ficus carica TaxID=3494 RepID=A0AA87ZU23_FICCA|nr:hypothetical protein TIFTF001_009594 [Ficus carica]